MLQYLNATLLSYLFSDDSMTIRINEREAGVDTVGDTFLTNSLCVLSRGITR